MVEGSNKVLDKYEKEIVKELILNPRISDNQISKNTKIPLKTVNRKRKILEEREVLSYHTYLNVGMGGLNLFRFRQLYAIKLKEGITVNGFFSKIKKSNPRFDIYVNYLQDSWIGETDGNLTIVFIVEADSENELINVVNGQIIPDLKSYLGEECIKNVNTIRLGKRLRIFRNYLPIDNMEKGKIKKEWPKESIFVDTIPPNIRKKFL